MPGAAFFRPCKGFDMASMIELTAEALREQLNYDPDTGIFAWRIAKQKVRAGQKCTATNKGGYIVIGIFGKYHSAHRLAWLYMTGEWPQGEIDHIDRCKTNNRWRNLRDVNHCSNMQNVIPGRRNKWGHRGIYQDLRTKKWVAGIRVNGTYRYLGAFRSPEAAAAAYSSAKLTMHIPNEPQKQGQLEAF